jgi:hypothetical protein
MKNYTSFRAGRFTDDDRLSLSDQLLAWSMDIQNGGSESVASNRASCFKFMSYVKKMNPQPGFEQGLKSFNTGYLHLEDKLAKIRPSSSCTKEVELIGYVICAYE